eukprot:SAG22_NODE_121_length_19129_cov_36.644614_11_plen_253_part_00
MQGGSGTVALGLPGGGHGPAARARGASEPRRSADEWLGCGGAQRERRRRAGEEVTRPPYCFGCKRAGPLCKPHKVEYELVLNLDKEKKKSSSRRMLSVNPGGKKRSSQLPKTIYRLVFRVDSEYGLRFLIRPSTVHEFYCASGAAPRRSGGRVRRPSSGRDVCSGPAHGRRDIPIDGAVRPAASVMCPRRNSHGSACCGLDVATVAPLGLSCGSSAPRPWTASCTCSTGSRVSTYTQRSNNWKECVVWIVGN